MFADRDSALVVSLVSLSHLVNHTYLVLLPPAFALIGPDLQATTAELGLAVGVLGAVVTVLQLPLGHVSDTYSRTLVLGLSLTFGAAGAALAAWAPTYEWLLAAQIVMGVGVAGHHPAHYPLLSAATADRFRGRAYSVHGFAGALGLAIPFAVVPAVVAVGGTWRDAFALVAVAGGLFAVACLLAFRAVSRDVTHPPDPEPLPNPRDAGVRPRSIPATLGSGLARAASRLRSGARTIAESPAVAVLTLLWFVNSVAAWVVRTYTPTLLTDAYGLAPPGASLAGSAMIAVGAVLMLAGGWLTDVTAPLPVMALGYLALVPLSAVLAAGTLPVVAAVGLVLGLAATLDVSRPARSTLTDRVSDRADVGRNFALVTVGIGAGGAVAPPLFGWVIAVAGVGAAFYGVTALAVVSLALAFAVDRTRSTDARASAAGDD